MIDADMAEIGRRAALGIRRFSAVTDRTSNRIHAGFVDGEVYGPPLSRYQKWMRASMPRDEPVTYHYTATFSAKIVER